MNKKVLTLCTGFLLAGGILTTVSAKSLEEAKEGVYYKVAVAASSQTAETYALDSDSNEKWTYFSNVEGDFDGSAWWTVEQVLDPITKQTIAYKLKNKEGVYYSVKDADGKIYDAFIQEKAGTPYWTLKTYDGNHYVWRAETTNVTNGWGIDLVEFTPAAYTAEALNHILGNGFGLQICKQVIKADGTVDTDKAPVEYTNLVGNVFTGVLVAKDVTDGVALYQGAENGKQIVLTKDTWGNQGGGTTQEGYIFKAVTASELASLEANDKVAAKVFTITRPATVSNDPLEVAVKIGGQKYELVVTEALQGEFRLTVALSGANSTADYTYSEAQKNQNTYVKFGLSNVADMSQFANKLWNIYKNGKVLSPADGTSFINASEVYAKGTEGLWLWNGAQFVNRESDKAWTPVTLRNTDTQYEFTNGEDVYTFVAQGTPAPNGTTDGYLASLSDDQLKQNAFWIASPLSVGDTLYISKGQNGVLEMTKDKAEAVEFRLARVAFGDKENNMQAQLQNGYLEDASKDKSNTDRVNLYQYSLVEAVSGDVLNYDVNNKYYVLEDVSGLTQEQLAAKMANVAKYVFKTKGNNLYNILKGVAASYNATDKLYKVTDADFTNGVVTKLYGAFNTGRLVASENAYESVQNDLFVVVNAEAKQYRGDFSNTGALDTVKIFRNDDPSYVLYEKGTLLADAKGEAIEGFLGMENVLDPQYATKQPAMLADTAKHANTYRPQYMFAVDAEYVADGWTCPLNPEHNTAAWREENGGHCADAIQDRPYMLGRYLVTLADSAQAAENAGVKEAVNKFKHEGYYRLGFVQAKHMGDSLIIASGTAAQDTIDLSKGYDLPCTFALKYVDEDRDAFTIETMLEKGYDTYGNYKEYNPAKNSKGYIKYQNGVPVVTDKKNEAWVFNLETLTGEENAPTANETIAAGNVVVAGTNGAVVVKGAEGKSVIVSTILGKVVANEVLTSDNAQITAPAGVVVVSVDGESFKVVVK